MQASTYQQAILDWISNGSGNACVNAVAGSGKSSTLLLAAKHIEQLGVKPSEVKIIVFGKANSLDLAAKFGDDWKESISTLHSTGWSLVKRELDLRTSQDYRINSSKYKWIAQNLKYISSKYNNLGSLRREGAVTKETDFLKLIDLFRLTNQQPTSSVVESLCLHFDLEGIHVKGFGKTADAIAQCLAEGERLAIAKHEFDFTDQIWLPVLWKLNSRSWFKPYKFLFLDEAQDLNESQLKLAQMLVGDGRMLAVGDRSQAIMGFAGAANDSYENIAAATKAIQLPLSICYRCPTTHITLVNKIFPNIPIVAAGSAKEGMITRISAKEIGSHLKIGDLVIARKTAPLVALCIRLIAQGIPATVKGRDIGVTIKRELEEIASIPGFRYEEFNEFCKYYKNEKSAKYAGLENQEKLNEALNDELEALTEIYKSQPNAKSVYDLGLYVERLFSDDKSPITLSTCHRAKGLEAERVFLHNAENMPMTWKNQLDWQYEQEENLLYVALTRSKNELFIIGNPSWLKEKNEEVESVEPEQATTEPDTSATDAETSNTDEEPGEEKQNDDGDELFTHPSLPSLPPLPGLPALPGVEVPTIPAPNETDSSDNGNDNEQPQDSHQPVRSNTEKREAVTSLLLIPAWRKLSNRIIADEAGVSASFVGKVRRELEQKEVLECSERRIDSNGRVIDVSSIGTVAATKEFIDRAVQIKEEMINLRIQLAALSAELRMIECGGDY